MLRPIFVLLRACARTASRLLGRMLLRSSGARRSWPEQCDILLVGSSVCAGLNADGLHGWSQELAAELTPQRTVVNEAIPGTNTWNAPFQLASALLRWRPSIVIISLTVGNDGLFFAQTEGQAAAIANGFLAGLPKIMAQAERAGARVIVTSVYPHSRYRRVHLPALRRVHKEMSTCTRAAAFIDFLTLMDDGDGRWRADEEADPAHPNSRGHGRMLEAARPLVAQVYRDLHGCDLRL